MPTETTSKNCPNPTASRESLQCPRCESTNTKFCYYNNYSLTQPRHFCKSCRRYWTHGGSLRDVPVGGSSRKSSTSKRRPRTPPPLPSSSHSPSNSSSTSTSALTTHEPKPTLSVPEPAVHVPSEGWFGYGLTESNAALWGTMGLLDFMGGSGNGVYNITNSNNNDWKLISEVEVGVGGLVDGVVGDTFAWPDLAISTPAGSTFK